jgi:O-antigen ligase
MILRLPRNFIFPLTTLAFVAIPVEYVNIIFTTTTRWIFLVLLTLYLLAKGRLLAGFQSLFGVALLVYCAWCMCTSSWSEVPDLSLTKAWAFSLIAVAFVSAGQEWIHERGRQKALIYLVPVTVVALFCASTGTSRDIGVENMELYEGLTSNPNMLGSLIVMALPLLLWCAYKYRETPQAVWLWLLLLAVALVLLVRTHSRASMMSAGMLGLGFCLSLKLSRTSFFFVFIGASLLVAAALSTAIVDTTYQRYVLKGGSAEAGVLYTRQDIWADSYKQAEAGGWYGGGYGVTIGDTVFQGGFTAVGYGREKGNAQLAIVEETGVVGLALYAILLVTLFARLVSAHRHEKNRDVKVTLGIITGALAGLTLMSVFEAWWVAPGSAESAYFWSLAGVGLGLANTSAYRSKLVTASRMAHEQPFYPATVPPQRRVKG